MKYEKQKHHLNHILGSIIEQEGKEGKERGQRKRKEKIEGRRKGEAGRVRVWEEVNRNERKARLKTKLKG